METGLGITDSSVAEAAETLKVSATISDKMLDLLNIERLFK
jgi:hypothetical protein